ncbi:MAG: hypothetical protein MUC38_15720 [Cyclobacteriaceae bacterium]|nr:hypothetical protein [Cyclobacteriaceae bacterium]
MKIGYESAKGDYHMVRGRLLKSVNDSIFVVKGKNSEDSIDVNTVLSIEKIGVSRYVKSAMLNGALSIWVASIVPGSPLDGSNQQQDDSSIFLSIGIGTVFGTIFSTGRLLFPARRADHGWRFSLTLK